MSASPTEQADKGPDIVFVGGYGDGIDSASCCSGREILLSLIPGFIIGLPDAFR